MPQCGSAAVCAAGVTLPQWVVVCLGYPIGGGCAAVCVYVDSVCRRVRGRQCLSQYPGV